MDIKKILFKTSEFDVEKSLPDAVIYSNKDGKIQWVSDKATEVFDTPRMHLLTSNICDFIENVQNMIANSLFSEKPILIKIVDKEAYLDMNVKEVETGYVLSFRPINEYNNILNDLNKDEDNELKNTFLLKIANDLKSPLQSIIGFSQAMTEGLGGNLSIQQEKYVKIINKNSSDLMYFISKVIELSQSEINNKTPELKIFNISNTIGSVVRFNEQLYKDKDIKWQINIDEEMKNTIISNEESIKLALQNIIEVIIRTVEMGEVSVNYLKPTEEFLATKNLSGDYALISISSSALLLSENDIEFLFEPYKIVDTNNRKNLLRSVILASVKNIIQSLKGYVWVESVVLKNTSFNILIPQGNT